LDNLRRHVFFAHLDTARTAKPRRAADRSTALINSVLTDEERAGNEDVIPKRLGYLLSLACA
jgi:hypothetical protein